MIVQVGSSSRVGSPSPKTSQWSLIPPWSTNPSASGSRARMPSACSVVPAPGQPGLVVADPGVLEEVLLVGGDHGLLPALAGERPDRLDVLPDRHVHVLGRGRVKGPAHVLGNQPCLLRHERDGRVAEERLELTLLAGVDRRLEDADDHGLLVRVSLARAAASRARAMATSRGTPPLPRRSSSGASPCSPA